MNDYCRQWGSYKTSSYGIISIEFLISFNNTNYYMNVYNNAGVNSDTSTVNFAFFGYTRYTSYFQCRHSTGIIDWIAEGYIS